MKAQLDRLLRDTTPFTLTVAIALGWSLFQFAHGVATFVVDALSTHLPPASASRFIPSYGEGVGWLHGLSAVALFSQADRLPSYSDAGILRCASVLSPDARLRVVAETHLKRVPNRVPE